MATDVACEPVGKDMRLVDGERLVTLTESASALVEADRITMLVTASFSSAKGSIDSEWVRCSNAIIGLLRKVVRPAVLGREDAAQLHEYRVSPPSYRHPADADGVRDLGTIALTLPVSMFNDPTNASLLADIGAVESGAGANTNIKTKVSTQLAWRLSRDEQAKTEGVVMMYALEKARGKVGLIKQAGERVGSETIKETHACNEVSDQAAQQRQYGVYGTRSLAAASAAPDPEPGVARIGQFRVTSDIEITTLLLSK